MSFVKFKPVASYFNFYNQIAQTDLSNNDLMFINENEKFMYAFKSTRDFVIFTNKRIILVDKKGLRAFRKTITYVSFESISSYSMTVHNLDTTFEFVLNSSHSMNINFYKPIPLDVMFDINNFISSYILKEK